MFTARPGLFGLVPGCANVTGDILILVVTVMLSLSLNCVRRSGHFEVGGKMLVYLWEMDDIV